MENEIYDNLCDSLNKCGMTAIKATDALCNALNILRDTLPSMPDKLNNNYLKMHGKRTIRRKALALYKRRHHSE